jgi:hypothetical protein
MSTLAEIEAAAEQLPAEEKQELILFLAARLRATGFELPPPRMFTKEQVAQWIADDEEGYRAQAQPEVSLLGLLKGKIVFHEGWEDTPEEFKPYLE